MYKDKNLLDSALIFADKAETELLFHHKEESYWIPPYNRYLIYLQLKSYDKADFYLLKSYDYLKNSKDRMNKGFVLFSILQAKKNRGKKGEFDQYLNEFLHFKKAGSSKPLDANHLGLLELFDNNSEAIKILEEKIRKIENDSIVDTKYDVTRMKLAENYADINQFEKAEQQLQKVEKEITGLSQSRKNLFLEYYQLYKRSHQNEKAFAAIEKYISLQDSSYNQILKNQLAEYEVKYQTKEKESENLRQKLVIAANVVKQRNLKWIFGILMLSAIIGFLIFQKRMKYQKQMNIKDAEIRDQKIKELEQTNKLLSMSSMIEGQESERLRIAHDLHDGLGGLLSTVKAHFQSIQREIDHITKLNIYEKTNKLIDEACGEVRRIAHDMVPYSLNISGLAGVLDDLKLKLESSGMVCELDLHHTKLDKVENQKAIMIYRIMQEVTNNLIKHSKATSVVMQFIEHEGKLHIMIEDNGVGFDFAEKLKGTGMGLKSIESRVRYLNGELNIDSLPGAGTTINMVIPLQ